ncbi:MAG: long-chain fatty acid--CoA ligase, partial [Acidobacteria bacterium]
MPGSASKMPNCQSPDAEDLQTITQLFLIAAERRARPDAFLSKLGGRYQGLSSEEALRRVAALAAAFDRLGIGRGDRVALLSENRVEWALTDYAVLGLGAVVVPIYPTLLEPDVEYILADSGAKGVVCSAAQLEKVLNVRSKLSELRLVVAMEPVSLSDGSVQSWDRLVAGELKRASDAVQRFRARALDVRPQEAASILYTSGTMGVAKGVVLTHSNIVSNVQACERLFPLGSRDVGMSFLPLSHIYERTLDYIYFRRGVSIAYAESPETLPQNLLEVRPTVLAIVPRVLEKIHERVLEAVRKAPLPKQKLFHWAVGVGREYVPYSLQRRLPPSSLRIKRAIADALVYSKVRARLGGRVGTIFSGSAPLSGELAEFFWAMGLPVYEGYGLTETSPIIAVNCPGHVKPGSVGRVIPGVEVKLGEELTDEEGRVGKEILVRG